MSATVKAAIASELAKLTQIVDFPTEPFGYGSDISCEADVDPNAAEVDAFSTLALSQAVLRRLDCPRGALPDDPDYGISLVSYVNRGFTADDIRSLAGQIRSEVLKDDRIESVLVTVRPSSDAKTIDIELAVLPVDASIGEFDLTLSASNSSLIIKSISGTT